MKKVIIISIVLIGLVAVMVANRVIEKSNQQNVVETDKTISVKTEPVTVGKIDGIMSYTGNVEGIHEAMIVSQTGGVIRRLNAIVGKKVSPGAVIAVIDNYQQYAGVEQARAQLLAAMNNHEKAKTDSLRVDNLYKQKVETKNNLELSQLNVKSTFAQMKGAQASLRVYEKQLSDTYVRATIGGFISSKDLDVGATVAPGSKICHIVDISKFKIKIMVSETDAVRLSPGKNVTVKIDALPDQTFDGKISTIGLSSENGTRSYPVEVVIDNVEKNTPIKSGMFARCEIFFESKEDALIIPERAVIMNNDGSKSVYVIENNKAVLKKVVLGLNTNLKYEVLSGIDKNARVVLDGKERLQNGIEIKEIK